MTDYWPRFFEARDRGLTVPQADAWAKDQGLTVPDADALWTPLPPTPGPTDLPVDITPTSQQAPPVSKLPRHAGGRPRAKVPQLLLVGMRRRGLNVREIAGHLERRGYPISKATVARRLKGYPISKGKRHHVDA